MPMPGAPGKAGRRLAPAVRCAQYAQNNCTVAYRAAETSRPSLRSGLTAYAALSPETNSSFVSVASRIRDTACPVGLTAPPRRLDRSNDGQDHTVLPYAEFA